MCTYARARPPPPPLYNLVCKGQTPPPPMAAYVLCTRSLAEKAGSQMQEEEFFNDEADPLKGWWKLRSWRGDVRLPKNVVPPTVGNLHNR